MFQISLPLDRYDTLVIRFTVSCHTKEHKNRGGEVPNGAGESHVRCPCEDCEGDSRAMIASSAFFGHLLRVFPVSHLFTSPVRYFEVNH